MKVKQVGGNRVDSTVVADMYLDDDDYLIFKDRKVSIKQGGYARTCKRENGKLKCTFVHVELMKPEPGQVVDHIDGNGLNNQRGNLRLVCHKDNMKNQRLRSNSTTGYKGVSPFGKRWRAYIVLNYRQKSLGIHDTPEQAALAYNEAAKTLFGEFARLNVV